VNWFGVPFFRPPVLASPLGRGIYKPAQAIYFT